LFARDMAVALASVPARQVELSWVGVAAGHDSPMPDAGRVLAVLPGLEDRSMAGERAAAAINRARPDVVWLQHTFGLFGRWEAPYTDSLGPFLAALEPPLVTTLHTVPFDPPHGVPAALRRICDASERLIVMSSPALRHLSELYDVSVAKGVLIPHAVHRSRRPDAAIPVDAGLGDPLILSFGLIRPGKGLVNAVAAMPRLLASWPFARYVIAGQDHPATAFRRDYAGYRAQLSQAVREAGVEEAVTFVDRFLSEGELDGLLSRAAIVLTPYLHPDQASSGTLARALGAGRVVVSSLNGHSFDAAEHGAVELLPGTTPREIADTVHRVLAHPARRRGLERRARAYSRTRPWSTIAERSIAVLLAAARTGQPEADSCQAG